APGRQGAQPTLGLAYNSAGANGWCGLGWALDVGYIQRDTRKGVPVLWTPNSSQSPLPQYDDSKGFVANFGSFSGSLVLVSSTNQNPVIYRPQVDTTFSTYSYYSYSTNSYWVVVDKGGNTFYFGETASNRMDNPKVNWTVGAGSSTFRWALDKIID